LWFLFLYADWHGYNVQTTTLKKSRWGNQPSK
jgi:hypothetical protein